VYKVGNTTDFTGRLWW